MSTTAQDCAWASPVHTCTRAVPMQHTSLAERTRAAATCSHVPQSWCVHNDPVPSTTPCNDVYIRMQTHHVLRIFILDMFVRWPMHHTCPRHVVYTRMQIQHLLQIRMRCCAHVRRRSSLTLQVTPLSLTTRSFPSRSLSVPCYAQVLLLCCSVGLVAI